MLTVPFMGVTHFNEGVTHLKLGVRHLKGGVTHFLLKEGVRILNGRWKRQLILGGTKVNAISLIVRNGFIAMLCKNSFSNFLNFTKLPVQQHLSQIIQTSTKLFILFAKVFSQLNSLAKVVSHLSLIHI